MNLKETQIGEYEIEGGPFDGAHMRIERQKAEKESRWRNAEQGMLEPIDGSEPWYVWTNAAEFDSHHTCRDPRVELEGYLSREVLTRMLERANNLPNVTYSKQREIDHLRPGRNFVWPKQVKTWPSEKWVDIENREVWVLPEYLHQKKSQRSRTNRTGCRRTRVSEKSVRRRREDGQRHTHQMG